MKTLGFILFFYFSFFSACNIYAGNNTITANYPAPAGSYNKIILQNLQGVDPTCSASNAGLLFMHTDASGNQSLEMCTSDGITKAVPYPETCFSRFCSWKDKNGSPAQGDYPWCVLNACPNGYTWIPTQQSPSLYEDVMTTYYDGSTYYYHVLSAVCCSCGDSNCTPGIYSTVNPLNS